MLVPIEGYFDESGSHDASPVLCVAGYLFEGSCARRFDREWRAALASYGLSYFHAVECAHRQKAFKRLTVPETAELEKQLIDIIGRNAIAGLGATIVADDYDSLMPRHPEIGRSYTFCARVCVDGADSVLTELGHPGQVAYFFEAGHESEGDTDRIISNGNRLGSEPAGRYVVHRFLDKKASPALQAADLLAWHVTTHRRRALAGQGPRLDYQALCEATKTKIVDLSRDRILEVAHQLIANGIWSERDPVAPRFGKP